MATSTNTQQLTDWLNGTATGGPNHDGRYPLTYKDGTTHYVLCPAAQALAIVDDTSVPKQFADAAAASATAAAGSATAAAGSATAAGTSKTNAGTSETNAKNSETNAAASKTAAATSATNAATSETNAAASKTAAATSATNASTSEGKAKTSETNAANSATAAASSAAQAAATVAGQYTYQGNWDPTPGTFPASPVKGQTWKVGALGAVGSSFYLQNEHIIYNGSGWDKMSGIGYQQLPASFDYNTLTEPGFYRDAGGTAVNRPVGSAAYGQLLVISGGGDTAAQVYWNYQDGRVWTRAGNTRNNAGGTWRAWNEFYHSGNLDPVSAAATFLGKTGNIGTDAVTNTAALWSALPVGYSRQMDTLIGVAGGLPEAGNNYFHKVANRNITGGWGGIMIGRGTGANSFVGYAEDNATLPVWSKLWTSANFDPTTKANLAAPTFTGITYFVPANGTTARFRVFPYSTNGITLDATTADNSAYAPLNLGGSTVNIGGPLFGSAATFTGDVTTASTNRFVAGAFTNNNTALNPSTNAAGAAFRANGNYGGGYGLVDGTLGISMYSVGGSLNFGFGSNTSLNTATAEINPGGQFTSKGTSPYKFRMVHGNYGAVWYNDGSNMYLLLTNSGDTMGGFNGLRPFYVSLSSGGVQMNQGVSVSGGLTADTITTTSSGGAYLQGNGSGIQVNGSIYNNGTHFKLAQDGTAWIREARTFVQGYDPGNAASDGDLWFW